MALAFLLSKSRVFLNLAVKIQHLQSHGSKKLSRPAPLSFLLLVKSSSSVSSCYQKWTKPGWPGLCLFQIKTSYFSLVNWRKYYQVWHLEMWRTPFWLVKLSFKIIVIAVIIWKNNSNSSNNWENHSIISNSREAGKIWCCPFWTWDASLVMFYSSCERNITEVVKRIKNPLKHGIGSVLTWTVSYWFLLQVTGKLTSISCWRNLQSDKVWHELIETDQRFAQK